MGKQAKKLVLAIRVTQAELDAFDEAYVHGGLTRSEVIRSKLRIAEARRRRGELSKSDAYDYQRAVLIKSSTNKIGLLLESVTTMDADSDRLQALPVISDLVAREIKKIEGELNALQLKSGVTDQNPARSHVQGELVYAGEPS